MEQSETQVERQGGAAIKAEGINYEQQLVLLPNGDRVSLTDYQVDVLAAALAARRTGYSFKATP